MEKLTLPSFSWGEFLVTGMVLLSMFLIIRFSLRMISRVPIPGYIKTPVKRVLHYLQLLFEPLALVLLASVFVFINPYVHGLVVALFLVAGFVHLKNYLSGRLIQLGNYLSPGRRLRTGNREGQILRMGRLGLQIQTPEGRHFLGYSRLLAEGYTQVSGEELGGLYRLEIKPIKADSAIFSELHLRDLFATAPYLDTSFPPLVSPVEAQPDQFNVRVLVREERHLKELSSLIKEWGYTVKIVEKYSRKQLWKLSTPIT